MWSGMSFALISHFWPKKSSRIDQSEDRRHPRLSREVNHKKWKKSNSILFFEKRKKIFFSNQLIFESRYISGPDRRSNTKTNLPVYRTEKQRWKEIKHKLKRTLRDSISNILLEQLLRTQQMESFIMQRENQMVLHALWR